MAIKFVDVGPGGEKPKRSEKAGAPATTRESDAEAAEAPVAPEPPHPKSEPKPRSRKKPLR